MPVLTYLKTTQHLWERGQDTFGDGRNMAIARLAVIGHLERKPYDYTQLAAATRLSRQQVMRRCIKLARNGWVTNKRDKERVLVLPTDALMDYMKEQVQGAHAVLGKWVKVAAMLGIVTLVSASPTTAGIAIEMAAATAGAVEEIVRVRRKQSAAPEATERGIVIDAF